MNQDGIEMHLSVGSPAYLKKELCAAITQQHLENFIWKIVAKDLPNESEYQALSRNQVDFQLIREVANGRRWTHDQRRCLLQAATGKFILAKRMIQCKADTPSARFAAQVSWTPYSIVSSSALGWRGKESRW